jgi:hypothetical protein
MEKREKMLTDKGKSETPEKKAEDFAGHTPIVSEGSRIGARESQFPVY